MRKIALISLSPCGRGPGRGGSDRSRETFSTLNKNAPFYILGFLASFGLKYHYSIAEAEQLRWILTPLARLVGLAGGIPFEWDPNTGFVDHSRAVIIAPACAGINFMIICFSTLFFTFVSRQGGVAAKSSWLGASLALSYLVTLCTNTVRILLSIFLYGAPIYGEWITPERVHRLAGTLVYICALVATYLIVEQLTDRLGRTCQLPLVEKSGGASAAPTTTWRWPDRPMIRQLGSPFAWYLLIALCVPILNGSLSRDRSAFTEHAMLTVAALWIFAGCFQIGAILKKKVDILNQTKEKLVSRIFRRTLLP